MKRIIEIMKNIIEFLATVIMFLLPTIIILGLIIGASMLKNGLVYGDPMCTFKQCVELKGDL